jgi:hypothetical protein
MLFKTLYKGNTISLCIVESILRSFNTGGLCRLEFRSGLNCFVDTKIELYWKSWIWNANTSVNSTCNNFNTENMFHFALKPIQHRYAIY